jgi:hypothetical protein
VSVGRDAVLGMIYGPLLTLLWPVLQIIRGNVSLPHGTGRDRAVAVFADDDAAVSAAKTAGAVVVGGEDLLATIAETKSLAVDVVIATPAMVPKLGKVARILGPRCVSHFTLVSLSVYFEHTNSSHSHSEEVHVGPHSALLNLWVKQCTPRLQLDKLNTLVALSLELPSILQKDGKTRFVRGECF